MPKLEDFDDCLCTLIERFGRFKSKLSALISSLTGLLQALKAILQLYLNPEDQLRQTALEFEKELAYALIANIEAPFQLVLAYSKGLSDCPPINTFTAYIKIAQNFILDPVYDLQYEIEQYVESLKFKQRKIDLIDRIIEILQKVQEAIDECGTTEDI